jgi:hypothetical protein
LKEKAQNLKDMQDPNNYKQVLKDDGGFDFFDPAGKKISVQAYSQVVGKRPSDILAKSENSLDRQYVQDHKYTEML